MRDGDDAQEDDRDGDHPGEDRPADEELRHGSARRPATPRALVDRGAGLDSVLPLDDDDLSGVQPRRDDIAAIDQRAERDTTHVHPVLPTDHADLRRAVSVRVTACCGTASAAGIFARGRRARTNMPGKRRSPGLGTSTRTSASPVPGSTAIPENRMRPAPDCCRPEESVRISTARPPRLRAQFGIAFGRLPDIHIDRSICWIVATAA